MSENLPKEPNQEASQESNQEDFPVICAWCKKEIKRSSVENSHGIREDCLQEQLKNLHHQK